MPRPDPTPPRPDADPSDPVVARFYGRDGRLHTLPRKRSSMLRLLDHLVQEFDLGRTYDEPAVNGLLARHHDDVAALRRYLVDDAFLTRDAGVYWRTGGTVDLARV